MAKEYPYHYGFLKMNDKGEIRDRNKAYDENNEDSRNSALGASNRTLLDGKEFEKACTYKIGLITRKMVEGLLKTARTVEPKSITSNCTGVCAWAFRDCVDLEEVYLEKCKFVDKGAFMGCRSLTKVELKNCTKVGDWTFEDTELKRADIGTKIILANGCDIDPRAFG